MCQHASGRSRSPPGYGSTTGPCKRFRRYSLPFPKARTGMKAILTAIALACLACSPGPTTPTTAVTNAPSSPLQLFRVAAGDKKLIIQMAPDDRVLDGAGVVIGTFNANSGV